MQPIFWWIIGGVFVYVWCKVDHDCSVKDQLLEFVLGSCITLFLLMMLYVGWSVIASLPKIEPLHFKWPT